MLFLIISLWVFMYFDIIPHREWLKKAPSLIFFFFFFYEKKDDYEHT